MPATIADISARLGEAARRFDIDVLDSCTSTNSVLLDRAHAGAPSGTVVIAARQTAGRGRRGREWHCAPGDSLTFSLLWRFARGTAPAGLSLAAGVAVARALAPASTQPPALKWPNDILMNGRKLGGILVELLPGAPHAAVIGIGINLRLPASMPDDMRAAAAALCEGGATPDPATLYATLLRELLDALQAFAGGGFAALREPWLAHHAFQDAPVRLAGDFGPPREGICRGVDLDGALLFESGGRVERVLSGEVSLRPV